MNEFNAYNYYNIEIVSQKPIEYKDKKKNLEYAD